MAADERNNVKLVLNVLRRMPPQDVDSDLVRLLCIVDPELEDEICQRVDVPLKVETDTSTGKLFVVCDYNRDGDSYRSPHSNQYFPAIEDGLTPPEPLRKLEQKFNGIFNVYRHQYFNEQGTSSVYLWELGEALNHWAGAFLIQKEVNEPNYTGQWSSIHVVEAQKKAHVDSCSYKVTSTVLVDLTVENDDLGKLCVAGSSSCVREKDGSIKGDVDQQHISNIGPVIEEAELTLRNNIENHYFGRTNQVISGCRVVDAEQSKARNKMANIASGMGKRSK